MVEKALSAAAGHDITVTGTATSLYSLIDTAAGATQNLPTTLNGAVIQVTAGSNVSFTADGTTPTADDGEIITIGEKKTLTGVPLKLVKMIRTSGSTDATVKVRVGWKDATST